MSQPKGELSPAQFEILQVLWEMGPPGGTVTEIWERIAAQRPVHRNTILSLVDRLDKRGWLRRRKRKGGLHYWPTVPREKIERHLTQSFVEDFFDGSASNLVMSLLGSRRLSPDEVQRLRAALEAFEGESREADRPSN